MKLIKGFKYYFVTEDGQVYSNKSGKLVKLKPYKYRKSNNIKICEIDRKCNDYSWEGSTVEDELPLEAHCILF